jgi:hypothetical protein
MSMKFTKTSILVSTILLTLGVAISWRDYRQLASARVSQSKLTAKLAEVGIRFDLPQPGEKVGIAKRQREKKEENHQESNSGLIALIREITADLKSSGKLDPTTSAKLRVFETRLKSLDTAQWRALLAEIQADKAFEDCGNTNAILSSMMMKMGIYFRDSDQPQILLTLAKQFPALFKDNGKSLDYMSSNLVLWTREDPAAAIAWLRENHAIFPRLADSYDIMKKMLPTVAIKDPAMAFQLIDELGITPRKYAAFEIAIYAENAENRTAILSALQHYVSAMPEGEERNAVLSSGVTSLVESAMMQGFETGTEWISHAGITPEQFADVIDHVAYDGKFNSSSQWIDWLIPHLPEEQAAEHVGKLVTFWVKKDHKSAGEWISHNANGPVKNAAIHAYSYEVAAYEPTVAAQWAMTLPAGENREKALKGVYENWLKTDAAGKEAFGKQHGFE